MYDVIIIGAGLLGSAAARHLSLNTNLSVCIVGPAEPDISEYATRKIFSSHYDEGRITRALDNDPIWAEVAQKSMERYDEIEELSAQKFYSPTGFLLVAPKACQKILDSKKLAKENIDKATVEELETFEKFPFLQIPENYEGLFEHEGGHISPRSLVAAQLHITEKQGATIIREVVERVSETVSHANVTTPTQSVCGKKVLITTGAFTNSLISESLHTQLDLQVLSRSVVLAEIDERTAQNLSTMPSIIYWKLPRKEISTILNYVYLLPPIRYPDGKWYIKIGHGTNEPSINLGFELTNLSAIADWFRSSGSKEGEIEMIKVLKHLLPTTNFLGFTCKPCVTTYTPTGYPSIGRLEQNADYKRIYVCVGGNGHSAKSSDELGRRGAMVVLGNHEPEKEFQIHYSSKL